MWNALNKNILEKNKYYISKNIFVSNNNIIASPLLYAAIPLKCIFFVKQIDHLANQKRNYHYLFLVFYIFVTKIQ